jgi:hypothetical protein
MCRRANEAVRHDHAGLADIAVNLAAKFGELACDKLGCAMLLEAKSGWACRSCRQAVISL